MTKRLKYFYPDTDRHGNRRVYFSPPGSKKTRLKHAEGTPEFRAEQKALMISWENGAIYTEPKTGTIDTLSIEWLLKSYMVSADFTSKAENTRSQRRNYYRRFNRLHGDVRYLDLTVADVDLVLEGFGDKKAGAQNFLKAMRPAWTWACDKRQELIPPDQNVFETVRTPQHKTTGYKRWSVDQVKMFRDFYPKYSTPRMALACFLFTGGRVSDVRLMGRRKVDWDAGRFWLSINQQKTGNPVEIPVIDILRDELGDSFEQIVWILTAYGAPFSTKSFSNKFSAWARRAGLPKGYSAHGLRKSLGSILAELGLSEDVIMTILGHTTSKEARTYIVDVNRRRLAAKGMDQFQAEVSHFWPSGKVGRK